MGKKILTISIAAYNIEPYITRTLNSLIVPEIMDKIEVLIENDGSTDNTSLIGKEYQEKYPNVFRVIDKENGGYGSTINRSIKEATGKYFKQLDGDDWFDTSHLPAFITLLEKIDVDYVVSESKIFDETKNCFFESDKYNEYEEGEYNLSDLDSSAVLSMYGSTFKTSVLKEMNRSISENCFYTDTEYVSYGIAKVKTVYFWHHSIYVYYVGREGQSVSVSGVIKHYKEHEHVLWNLLELYYSIPEEEIGKKKFLKNRVLKEAAVHFKFLCFLPYSKQHYRELLEYKTLIEAKATDLKKDIVNISGFVKMLYRFNFKFYFLMRQIALMKR
jgi:glycosyltransferase involved in cell wall biosynthesis